MSHKTGLIVSGLAASVAAFGITSGLISAKDAAIASLFAVPGALVTHIISDSKAQKRIRESDSKLSKALRDLDSANTRTTFLGELEGRNNYLQTELNKTREALEVATEQHRKAFDLSNHLKHTLTLLQGQVAAFSGDIEALQAEVEEWESEFSNRVTVESDRLFQIAKKAEIDKIFAEHDKITSEAMSITEAFQKWGMKVSQRFQDKNAAIEDTKAAYQQNIREFTTLVTKERDCYLDQIDLLNQRIAQLQHELAGDLVEPEYLGVAYSVEGRIANDIAKEVFTFTTLQIPLAVKGYHTKPDGSTDVAYSYSRLMGSTALIEALKRQSEAIAKSLRIHKITSIRKLEIADLLVLTFRREPSVKEDTIRLIAGTPDQFLEYVASHPIRYRLIAEPGTGKTPITAVMVSEILKVGGTRGNTGKGRKIPNTLVTVSCPDVESSQKDADYPLEIFLKYGNTTAAVKSFSDADEDWKYRKCDTNYAQSFFQLWVWDELDNTLNNADDPKAVGEKFKNFLKQAHHTGVGWIVSGQSVMTKQIPGFMDDDRELFTQVIIGTSKIRKYLEKYGKKILSAKVVTQLLNNLDDLESYIEDKNALVTDAARLLRLALILDDKSPKLYFLPNLDSTKFDTEEIGYVITQADQMKCQFLAKTSGKNGSELVSKARKACTENIGRMVANPPFPTIGGSDHSNQFDQIPHCPHCGGSDLKVIENGKRHQCKGCTKRFVTNKAVWK
jgi:hypothetical protein